MWTIYYPDGTKEAPQQAPDRPVSIREELRRKGLKETKLVRIQHHKDREIEIFSRYHGYTPARGKVWLRHICQPPLSTASLFSISSALCERRAHIYTHARTHGHHDMGTNTSHMHDIHARTIVHPHSRTRHWHRWPDLAMACSCSHRRGENLGEAKGEQWARFGQTLRVEQGM